MSDPGAPVTTVAKLAYAAPQPKSAAPPTSLFHIARVCWWVPMTLGVATLFLFALTHEPFLPIIGFLALLGGGAMWLVGVICLGVFALLLRGCDTVIQAQWRDRVSRLFLLLFLNLFVAAGCVIGGLVLM